MKLLRNEVSFGNEVIFALICVSIFHSDAISYRASDISLARKGKFH